MSDIANYEISLDRCIVADVIIQPGAATKRGTGMLMLSYKYIEDDSSTVNAFSV